MIKTIPKPPVIIFHPLANHKVVLYIGLCMLTDKAAPACKLIHLHLHTCTVRVKKIPMNGLFNEARSRVNGAGMDMNGGGGGEQGLNGAAHSRSLPILWR